MSNFLKKALNVFVEFENKERDLREQATEDLSLRITAGRAVVGESLNDEEIDKFEKHFHALFEKANLPGPDYFEFWKMMETLESHVPDERTRMAAVFATLAVQGLSKEKLADSAEQYRKIVESDKKGFMDAVSTKLQAEIEDRKQAVAAWEKKNAENAELVRKLTEEITANQNKIKSVNQEIGETESRILSNKKGYNTACDAMMAKIVSDIQKIQTKLF